MSDLVLGPVIGKLGGGVEVHHLDVNHTHVSNSSGSIETVAVLDVAGRLRVAVKMDSVVSTANSPSQSPALLLNGVSIVRYSSYFSQAHGAVSGVVDGPVTIATEKNNTTVSGDPSFTGTIFWWEEPEQQ